MANQMMALGIRPVQTPNMLAQAADVLAISDLVRQQEGRQGLQRAIAGGMAPTDPRIMQYGQIGQETYKTALAGRDKELEQADRRVKMIGGAAGYLRNNPTPDAFNRSLQSLLANGVVSPEEAQAAAAEVGNDPAKIKAYADRVFTQAIDAEKQLMQMYSQDVGGAQQVIGVDPVSGQTRVLSRTGKSLTPGQRLEQQQLQAAQQNQAIVNAMLSGQSAAAAPGAAPANALAMPPGAGTEDQQAQLRNQISQLRMAAARGNPQAAAAAEQLESLITPKGAGATPAAIQEYNLAVTQGFSGTFQDYQRESASLRNWSQPIELAYPNPQTGETEIGLFSYNSVTNETKPVGQTPLAATAEVGEMTPAEAPATGAAAPMTKAPTPAERAKQEKTQKGRQAVDDILNQISDYYTELDKLRGVPSTERNVFSNVAAYTGAAMPFAGRALGTKEQQLRDQITQIRSALVREIKNATGMSAQELNSNVELQLALEAATDPTISIQANLETLRNLSTLYGSGRLAQGLDKATGGATGGSDIDALLEKYK